MMRNSATLWRNAFLLLLVCWVTTFFVLSWRNKPLVGPEDTDCPAEAFVERILHPNAVANADEPDDADVVVSPDGRLAWAPEPRTLIPLMSDGSEVTDALLAKISRIVHDAIVKQIIDEEDKMFQDSPLLARKRSVVAHAALQRMGDLTRVLANGGEEETGKLAVRVARLSNDMADADVIVEDFHEVGVEPGGTARWLDFGADDGSLSRLMTSAFPTMAWQSCRHSDEVAPGEKIKVNRFGTCETQPFDAASFDVVVANDAWTHFSQREALKWLEEMHRILKPGGYVWLSAHGLWALQYGAQVPLSTQADWLGGIMQELYREGYYFHPLNGDNEWGFAAFTSEWMLARVVFGTQSGWELAYYASGHAAQQRDTYVLRKRAD